MEHSKIPKDQVFAKLRGFKVKHLGEVKRLYLEADGSFSLLRVEAESTGLCIFPEWDKEFIGRLAAQQNKEVCNNCGCRRQGPIEHCNNCHSQHWVMCVL